MSFEVLRDPRRYLRHRLHRAVRQILPRHAHRRHSLHQAYGPFVSKGDLCFDIGAHVGDVTAAFLGLGGRVVAVEPQASCVEQLHRSFDGDGRVTIVPAAVSDRSGTIALAICEEATTISTVSDRWRRDGRFARDYRWSRLENVPALTLDQLVATYGVPAFCKIDIEGHDAVALRGLTSPIPQLSFEFAKEFPEHVDEAVRHLVKIGTPRFNFALGESRRLVLPDWVGGDDILSAIAALEDPLAWGDVYVTFER